MFRGRSWVWWLVVAVIVYVVWRKFGARIKGSISKVTS